jgi:hypothetical protein
MRKSPILNLEGTVKKLLLLTSLALTLSSCSSIKSERLVDLEGQTGSTVARYGNQYCDPGEGDKANPNLWYYSLTVDRETRIRHNQYQTRNVVVGLQYDGRDFSCTSRWVDSDSP